MLNKDLPKEARDGFPRPIYFIWSEEGCFLEEALDDIVEKVIAGHPADFNYDVFYPTATPQEIMNAASTLPFMAPRRLVVLRDFHQFNASLVRALMPYFKSPSESTCMVVLSHKTAPSAPDAAWKVYALSMKEWDIPAWLKQTAAKKGVRLSDDAVDTLIDYIGYEPGQLMREIEKLSSSVSGTVTGKHVASVSSMMREFSTFDLVDSIVSGNSTRSFRVLRNLIETMSTPELPLILGTLNWHYRQFYSLWLNKGKRPQKMKEKTFKTLSKHVPSYSEEDFFGIFRSLHEADLGMKMSGRPELVLEALLIRLLQKKALSGRAV